MTNQYSDTAAPIEELLAARAEGLTWPKMSERFGVHERGIRKRVADYWRKNPVPPAAPAVPDGFEITKLSTRFNKKGRFAGQAIQAKPESFDESELIPAGHIAKGYSTLTNAQGDIVARWTKTKLEEAQRYQLAIEAAKTAFLDLPPLAHVTAPATSDDDLCTLYTLTDCHVGMLAWGREAGEPWDLGIAEQTLGDTFTQMIDAAPPSAIGIVNQLGDWLHFDSLKSVTPEHGHLLDADGRYQKVVEVAVRILRRVVDAALQKHTTVKVLMAEGNHDPAGSVWLRVLFGALYAKNPRVIVENSPLPYVVIQHGVTMLGFHHGHLAKHESMPLLFAAKFAEMWGATKKRYIHTGHKHHVDEKEFPGVKVIQHPTLAAADAYAARGGWLSERQAMSVTYHRARGEIARGYFLPVEV